MRVHEGAARGVDDQNAVAALGKSPGIENVVSLLGERRVQGDDVRGSEQILQGHEVANEIPRGRGGLMEVVGQDVHLKGVGQFRHPLADPPHANDAQRLPRQFHPAGALVGEVSVLWRQHDFPQPPGKGEDERKGVFRDRGVSVKRQGADQNSPGATAGHIDVIHRRGAGHEQFQSGMRREKCGIDFRVNEAGDDLGIRSHVIDLRSEADLMTGQRFREKSLPVRLGFCEIDDHGVGG